MHESPLSRRSFLGVAGGVALWLAASPAELLAASTGPGSSPGTESGPGYRVLTAAQASAFDAFAAQVIPGEPGSPGAREASVTRFADNALASFVKEQRPAFEKALTLLDAEARRQVPLAAGFSTRAGAQQVAVMRAMDKSQHDAFETLRMPYWPACSPTQAMAATPARWAGS